MLSFSTTKPYIRSVPDAMRPFAKAGKIDDIFRPRSLGNGLFATATGYGVSFSRAGIDSEGLDRATLDHVSKQIAIANRALPGECVIYEYLVTANTGALPARPITQEIVRRQAQERSEFLRANARFKSVRLIVTLYIPGKVAETTEEFTLSAGYALRYTRTKPQRFSYCGLAHHKSGRFGFRAQSQSTGGLRVNELTITITADASPFLKALQSLSEVSPEVINRFVGAIEAGSEPARIDVDRLSTAGTGDLRIVS